MQLEVEADPYLEELGPSPGKRIEKEKDKGGKDSATAEAAKKRRRKSEGGQSKQDKEPGEGLEEEKTKKCKRCKKSRPMSDFYQGQAGCKACSKDMRNLENHTKSSGVGVGGGRLAASLQPRKGAGLEGEDQGEVQHGGIQGEDDPRSWSAKGRPEAAHD